MKKVWLISGAMMGCLAGVSLGACGNSTTGNSGGSSNASSGTHMSSTSGTMSSSSGMGGMTGSSSSSGNPASSSSGGMGGMTSSSSTSSSGMCSKVGTLHPPMPGATKTLYCPFSGVDGGAPVSCDPTTQHCCETPAGGAPSACQPTASACMTGMGYTDWQCEDPVADCKDATKPVCCAPGASIGLGMPGCGNFAHTMTHTTCVANAAACTGIQMCTSDGECPAGKKCTPFSKAGNQVGGCM